MIFLYLSIGPKLSDEFDHVTPDFPENLATGPESLFTLSEISEYEVFQLLNDLKISNDWKMIELDDWKKAWVVPIYKSENRKKCENYRPISILSIICKIFERSVFNQLYEFLNSNSLLSKHQFGFRPKILL